MEGHLPMQNLQVFLPQGFYYLHWMLQLHYVYPLCIMYYIMYMA